MHPCSVKRERAAWSHKQCNVINRDLFSKCHVAVDPRPYFDACYFDTCGCDMGGDCECLCTAISAYAEACNEHGIHIKWRSQELCRKNYFFVFQQCTSQIALSDKLNLRNFKEYSIKICDSAICQYAS